MTLQEELQQDFAEIKNLLQRLNQLYSAIPVHKPHTVFSRILATINQTTMENWQWIDRNACEYTELKEILNSCSSILAWYQHNNQQENNDIVQLTSAIFQKLKIMQKTFYLPHFVNDKLRNVKTNRASTKKNLYLRLVLQNSLKDGSDLAQQLQKYFSIIKETHQMIRQSYCGSPGLFVGRGSRLAAALEDFMLEEYNFDVRFQEGNSNLCCDFDGFYLMR